MLCEVGGRDEGFDVPLQAGKQKMALRAWRVLAE